MKGDLIKDISYQEYDQFSLQDPSKIKNGIHFNNLDRFIRVRNILKHGYDKKNDFLGFGDIKKFKQKKTDFDYKTLNSIKSMGPPHFLKTKFKLSTINKTKNIEGLYFRSAK